MKDLKMYIAVREDFPDYMTPTLVGHAVLRHHLFQSNDQIYSDWIKGSFKKCVIRVNMKEFNKIKELSNVVCSLENNTLNGEISCLTIVVNSDNIPNVLKFAKLWKPKEK